eukprot:4968657-Prymnesium_polylepis.1
MAELFRMTNTVNYTIFDGVNSSEVPLELTKGLWRKVSEIQSREYGRRVQPAFDNLSKTEQSEVLIPCKWRVAACYLSHVNILAAAAQRGYPSYLVLEDDAEILQPTMLLSAVHSLPLDWRMAYLGWNPIANLSNPALCSASQRGWCRVRGRAVQNTHAMAVHAEAYSPLLEMLRGALRSGYFAPVDIELRDYIARRTATLPTYAAVPMLVGQASTIFGSEITGVSGTQTLGHPQVSTRSRRKPAHPQERQPLMLSTVGPSDIGKN